MFRRKNSGVVLIEAAIIMPLLLLLLFGILEVYRMRVAERFVDNVATSIAIDLSSRRQENKTVIENIIKSQNADNSIRIMSDNDAIERVTTIDTSSNGPKFQYLIGLQENHTSATNMQANAGDDTFDRRDMIMVTCSFKYEFLMQLTKMAFMGGKSGDLYITKKHFIKSL